MTNIGAAFSEKGDYEKALENYNKCLEIQIKIFGSESILVAGTLRNIGLAYSGLDYMG